MAAGMEKECIEIQISRRKACTCNGNEGLLRCHIKMQETLAKITGKCSIFVRSPHSSLGGSGSRRQAAR